MLAACLNHRVWCQNLFICLIKCHYKVKSKSVSAKMAVFFRYVWELKVNLQSARVDVQCFISVNKMQAGMLVYVGFVQWINIWISRYTGSSTSLDRIKLKPRKLLNLCKLCKIPLCKSSGKSFAFIPNTTIIKHRVKSTTDSRNSTHKLHILHHTKLCYWVIAWWCL